MMLSNATTHIRAAIVVLALAIPLAAAGPSAAHSLTLDKARAAAGKQAAKIKRETGAKTSSVVSCSRVSTHKVSCKVRSTYSTGLRRCVTPVLIYFTSHRDATPGAKIGRSSCS